MSLKIETSFVLFSMSIQTEIQKQTITILCDQNMGLQKLKVGIQTYNWGKVKFNEDVLMVDGTIKF